MSKFPGLSVLAEPDRVGPVAFSGSRTIVADALKLMAELDRCPTRVEVQASILVKGRTESASRGAGLQLRIGGNDFVLGYANPSGAGISIDIPQLSAFIAAAKANAGFVQLSTIGGQLLEGSEIVLKDGSEVPIRGEAIVTDRETRQSVTYRSVGHNLTLRLQSVGDYLVGEVEHELSTLGATTDLGPTFGTRSTTTAFRVKPFEPLAISLSGLDGGHEERRKGILSAFTAKSRENASAVLILALKPLSCELELAGTETLHGRGGRP
jgi:IMP dehydrogenase/GMP reductase